MGTWWEHDVPSRPLFYFEFSIPISKNHISSLNDICPNTFNLAVMSFHCKVLVKLQFQISRDPVRWGTVQQISSTLRCQEFQDTDTQNSPPFYITPRTHTHQEGEGTPPLSITHMYKREARGYLSKGKWIGGERFVSGRGECVHVKR